jgi:flavodoxin
MVVYDSVYGNTEKIAAAVAAALGSPEDVAIARASDARPEQLTDLTLLIVGSPTQKFRPIAPVTAFLKSIPKTGLKGIQVAAFDTRFTQSAVDTVRILAFFVNIFGYAAEPIADRLQKKGGVLAAPPEGFYVADTEGPLLEGELERAASWARQIVATLSSK